MKTLDIPKSGKCGLTVWYQGRYGQVARMWLSPKNTQTSPRRYMRDGFGSFAPAWSRVLTQAQRDAWNVAGPKVQSKTRLSQSGKLTGQQLFQGMNSALWCIGRYMLLIPTAPVVFCHNPVGQLILLNGENGVRLLVKVTGPVVEDIMVFGQAPCSAGRSKRRNVSYLGLLPAPVNGFSDITDLYKARYGEPRAGEKVFIVTRQQKNGWEGRDYETNEIVPGNPTGQQAAATGALTLMVHMYKGCTREVQGSGTLPAPDTRESAKPGMPVGKAAGAAPSAPKEDCQWPKDARQLGPKAILGGNWVAGADSGGPR